MSKHDTEYVGKHRLGTAQTPVTLLLAKYRK